MKFNLNDKTSFNEYSAYLDSVADSLEGMTDRKEIDALRNINKNFLKKTDDFFRDDRKLNIGVMGQVKAGKSSFLNTLLFGGKEVLPKAATPKTAVLTKMEYSEENSIEIEYYTEDEWNDLEALAADDYSDESTVSAREIIEMAKDNGIDPRDYVTRGSENMPFDSYDELTEHLNDYVGENGKLTPVIKSVTLHLCNEEFDGISIVDTPGLNDPIVSRTVKTREFMELCDVVFFLSQSDHFLDAADADLLKAQLPQKGVKRLVLAASKFDSALRDVLRRIDHDDLYLDEDDCDDIADNIPDGCAIIKRKLGARAKKEIGRFIKDLKDKDADEELISVLSQCEEPVMISAMAHDMTLKSGDEYNAGEKNLYGALSKFSSDVEADLKLISNFDRIREIYSEIIADKETTLVDKANSFVSTSKGELRTVLGGFKDKAEKRLNVVLHSDKETLDAQRKGLNDQIDTVRSDVEEIFGSVISGIEVGKQKALAEMRGIKDEFANITENTGTRMRTGSRKKRFLIFFKRTEYYTYPENYSYYLAADAAENFIKFSSEASNLAEAVFTDSMNYKEIKRKLLNVIVKDFDLGSESYSPAAFRLMVEEAVAGIEFPTISIDVGGLGDEIIKTFSGEIESADEKNRFRNMVIKTVQNIFAHISDELAKQVALCKSKLSDMADKTQESLLRDILKEFDELVSKCGDKEKEAENYRKYISALEKILKEL